MKVTLIGYMGCGKSTIGKELSKKLKLPFYDLDKEIEISQNISIRDIFKKQGEQYFRKIEHAILKKILFANKKFILALGGGTPLFYNAMEIINNNSLSFYLSMTSLNLFNRLTKKEKNKRPIINSIPQNKLKNFIQKNLIERNKFYNLSKYKINILTTQSIEEICNSIIYKINKNTLI